MIRWDTNTRLRLVRVVLLISIVLTGCGQSIPHKGESVDSVSSRNESEVGVRESEKSEAPNQLLVQGQPHTAQQVEPKSEEPQEPQVQGGSANVPSSEQPDADDASSDGAARDQQKPEAPTQELSEYQAQAAQEKPEVTTAQEKTAGAVGDERTDGAPAESQNAAPADQAAEPSPSNSTRTPNNEEKQQLEWDGDNTLTFGELYASVGVRGIVLSDKVEALTDKEVEMSGFMAPPLTAGVRFFVLTKSLMAVCPFCSTDADWPTDIVVVYLPDGEEMNPTEHPVKVTGTLDTGSYRDEDTGFVSLVRIYADKVEVLR